MRPLTSGGGSGSAGDFKRVIELYPSSSQAERVSPPVTSPRRARIPRLGCGYAVCALLALVGSGLLFAAEAKWRSGERNEAWVVGGIGGLICLAAIGFIAPMQRTVARAKARRAREDAKPDEPWTWEPAWVERNGIPQSGRRNGRVMMFVGFVAVLASLPGVLAMPKELGRGNLGILLVLLFPAIGIAFLSVAATDLIRRRKYGLARFVPESVPVPFGGELVGMVLVDRSIQSTSPGKISLDCYRTTLTQRGNKRTQADEVIAHNESEISPADWTTTVGESRLFVNLPIRGGVVTSMTPLEVNHPTYEWRLRVSVPTAGADFVAEFVLPVFDRANAASGS